MRRMQLVFITLVITTRDEPLIANIVIVPRRLHRSIVLLYRADKYSISRDNVGYAPS